MAPRYAAAASTQSSPAAGRAVSQAPPAESISRTSSETRSPMSTGATSAFADPALKHGQVDTLPGGRQPPTPWRVADVTGSRAPAPPRAESGSEVALARV